MQILGFERRARKTPVLLIGGCSFNCPFCLVFPLVKESKKLKPIPFSQIIKKIYREKEIIIRGGEPLMHPEIFPLCRSLKSYGLKIKIVTNGYFPYVLMELIEEKLLDSVSLKIITAFDERYERACGRRLELGLILRTIELLKEGKIDYEFRTTLIPKIVGREELLNIGQVITGAKTYLLEQFNPRKARTARFRKIRPYSRKEALELVNIIKPYVQEVKLK